jgi:serine/threonine-protein kinase HipA
MEKAAGLELPTTRLFETTEGDRFFGVRRFDRAPGNHRYHVHTFGNLIETNFRIPSCDYRDLLKATTILTRNHGDVLRAFHQMAFNVLAHNRDDHVKNFAFVFDAESNAWSLSPAYDLTFARGPGGEHTMTVRGEGASPTREDMLRLAPDFDIRPAQAKEILERTREAVADWADHADSAGVSSGLRKDIEAVL